MEISTAFSPNDPAVFLDKFKQLDFNETFVKIVFVFIPDYKLYSWVLEYEK